MCDSLTNNNICEQDVIMNKIITKLNNSTDKTNVLQEYLYELSKLNYSTK